MVAALQDSDVPFRCVPVTAPVRTNIAVTEMDGTTTKINEPGAEMGAAAIDALTRSVVGSAEHASWVVMSGSLPPGMPDDWYAKVVAMLAHYPCKVAIDTSDRPLTALVDGLDRAAPDLIKPNAEELAGVIGYHRRHWKPQWPKVIRSPSCWPRNGSSTAVSARCLPPSAPRAPSWSTQKAAGSPPRRRSCRAAPSAQATPAWPATSAQT